MHRSPWWRAELLCSWPRWSVRRGRCRTPSARGSRARPAAQWSCRRWTGRPTHHQPPPPLRPSSPNCCEPKERVGWDAVFLIRDILVRIRIPPPLDWPPYSSTPSSPQVSQLLWILRKAGLGIKNPPKKPHPKNPTQKNHLKNPLRMFFFRFSGFFKFLIFFWK